jgi:hypothetical protein
MKKFPLDYVIVEEKKQVWVKCNSSTTAIAIPTLIKKFFPGYTGHIASESYFESLKIK